MIDVSLVRDVIAIAGVFIGLTYYIFNIRELRRNRRITLTNTVLQPFMTVEGNQLIMDLWGMEWSDLEDYKTKYDHRTNPENYAKRIALWNTCENIGTLYREGLLDLKTLYSGSQGVIGVLWLKFQPVISMYRESDYDKRAYENFEYVALKMDEYTTKRNIGQAVHKVLET